MLKQPGFDQIAVVTRTKISSALSFHELCPVLAEIMVVFVTGTDLGVGTRKPKNGPTPASAWFKN
jgi:hypothetical protein